MKFLLITLIISAGLVACDKDDSGKPEEKPPVEETTTTTLPPPPVCTAEGMTVDCYGDWIASCRYHKDKDALVAAAEAMKSTSCMWLDGQSIYSGFGPCIKCVTMGKLQSKSLVKNGMSDADIEALNKKFGK